MLLKRIQRRSKRFIHEWADVSLRRRLSATARPVRSLNAPERLAHNDTIVVTAHPDDESIAAAVLMQQVPRLGVVCVTNGAPKKESYARQAGFDNWLDYAFKREREIEAALALLNRDIAPFECLGIGDQEATHNLVVVTRHLVTQITGFQQVITHAYEGGHPDHDSTAFCVHAACALIQRSGTAPPVIIEAPLYNAPAGRYVHQIFLPHPDAGPVLSVTLSQEQQTFKRKMYACHETQNKTFNDFHVEKEQFRVAPRYHFCASPHSGEVGYNQFRWPITGRVWRRTAWKAMRELDLLDLA